MKLMSATQGIKTRQEARKVSGIGKIWKPGDSLDVAYPIFWDANGQPQILTGQEWGHPIDPKELQMKKIFWPTHSQIVDGEPTKPDVAYRASRVMRLLQEGAYNLERSKLENAGMNKSALTQSLRKLDKEFDIDEETGRIGKKPAIANLKYIVTTEVLAVPMKDVEGNLVPETTKARIVAQDLSDQKIRSLNELLQTAKYRPAEGAKYFWVRWTFGTDEDKKISGNVKPIGLEPKDTIDVKFADDFMKIKDDLETLPADSEMIMKRNSAFQKGSEADLMQALMSYFIRNEDKLEGLVTEEEDQEKLRRVAKTIYMLRLPSKNSIIAEEIENCREDWDAEQAASAAHISTDPYVKEDAPTAAPKIEDMIDPADIQTAKAEAGTDEDESIGYEDGGIPNMAGM